MELMKGGEMMKMLMKKENMYEECKKLYIEEKELEIE
jgi:hypothetical protein